ncbi:aspartic-type endopeptidase [Rhodotorula toruloides]|uniref:Aspartic-type endopeptidase n=1 Tax=Rhodotorula toruloides TaxID=5286 RepID=A0A511K6S0_RHOTO|nr:aspartic-type endopeptidase [Rhodotorula toruloides]
MPSPLALALSLAALATASHLAAASPLVHPQSALETRSQHSRSHITIPIRRRNPDPLARRDAESFRRKAESLRAKYGGVAPNMVNATKAEREKRQHSIQMTSYQDSEWYGEIDVGTPASGFSVVLDTGSADLILAEPNCQGCNSATPGYSPSSSSTSSTSQSSFQITYGSGSASGALVKDSVSIGNYTQPNQIFAACDSLQNIVDGTISGILGLGWQRIASSGAEPLVQSLAANGTLPQNVFGFAFQTHTFTTQSASTAPGGELTIGGLDTAKYSGSINWIDIAQPAGYWAIPLQDITVGGKSLGITDDQVVIDTGTTLIGMPTAQAQQIYAQIPNSQQINLQGQSGYYSFPCTQKVNVSFKFGGVSYPIQESQFNAGAVDSRGQYCLGAVFALETQSSSISFIVGDAFLTGVYNAYRFNPASVGFATLGSGGSSASSGSNESSSNSSSGSSSGSRTNSAASSSARKEGAAVALVAAVVVALLA